MKKSLSVLLALMLLALCCAPSLAEGDYHQAPMLDAKVESGELPPVEERLPNNPKLVNESSPEALDYEIGAYGGDLRTVTSSVNWDGDVFIGLTEQYPEHGGLQQRGNHPQPGGRLHRQRG